MPHDPRQVPVNPLLEAPASTNENWWSVRGRVVFIKAWLLFEDIHGRRGGAFGLNAMIKLTALPQFICSACLPTCHIRGLKFLSSVTSMTWNKSALIFKCVWKPTKSRTKSRSNTPRKQTQPLKPALILLMNRKPDSHAIPTLNSRYPVHSSHGLRNISGINLSWWK